MNTAPQQYVLRSNGAGATYYDINPAYTQWQEEQKAQRDANDPFGSARMNQALSPLFGGGDGNGTVASVSKYGADANPWLTRLNTLLDNPDSINESAAYKFRYDQGQKALERSAAAKGSLNSGNTLAALVNYGQGQASQEYGSQMDRLAGLYGTAEGANASRYGADTSAAASNKNTLANLYGNLYTTVGSPDSLKRTRGLQTIGSTFGSGWSGY